VNLFEKMSLQDYNDVMRPKVDGIWHLHNQLSKVDLDFFIMLSSSVGLIGDPSQAAYVSASVFQDAFADFRRNLGLPAVTLDLGKVANIGILAEEPAARRGARALWGRDLQEDEVMAMIKWAIVHSWDVQGPNSTVIGLKNWSQAADPVFQAPIFARFRRIGAESSREDGQEVRTALPIRISLNKAKSPEEAAQKVLDELLPKVSSLLIISVEEIKLAKSLLECGMDSLVAVELRNWLIREFEATLPIMELMENIPLQRLSFKIARRSKLVNPAIFDGAD
ncbi:MAG: hypothetical protein LQ342_002283, partial [Letrouitia transgressa]